MFQKIASMCSIGSFLVGIYIILSGNPEWQWYAFFGIGISFIVVGLIGRKHKLKQAGKVITLKGIQPLPYSLSRKIQIEVFYPRTFKHPPNLTILFQKSSDKRRSGRPGIGSHDDGPEYNIVEQRPDGFKCEIHEPSLYQPIIKWQANGELETGSPKLTKENGYIGGCGPT